MIEKILIIGSEGFIGKHAVVFFNNLNYDVYGADILDINSDHYYKVNDALCSFEEIFSDNTFSICINLSGAANVSRSMEEPYIDFELNVINVIRILEAIRITSPNCKFVNFSSAAVYGNPDFLPIKEISPTAPISPYGYHKLFSENLLTEYHNIYKLQTLSLRVFSVYGEGLKKQLFWDLYNKYKNNVNNEIVLSGAGTETRDFIFIQDLLKALLLLINNMKFEGQKVNIGNGKEVKISEAVGVFFKIIDSNVKIIYNNQTREGDPKNWEADISILKKLGYRSDFDLEVGLKRYVNWLQND
jgi:UDP-glucose 4-epimerase